MKILITGGSGSLGKQLKKVFPNAFAPSHLDLDIKDYNHVQNFINDTKPDSIIHTAALVDIRRCETNRKLAWETNVVGTENIVNAMKILLPESLLVYTSTACVFRGDEGNYNEKSIPFPKNFYALTKLIGETISKQIENHLIIRTNFVPREKWKYPRAFIDRFGTYLFADDVAKAIKKIIEDNKRGIIHICGDKKMSMYELAKITTPEIKPLTMDEYLGPPVTRDMSLSSVIISPFTLSK